MESFNTEHISSEHSAAENVRHFADLARESGLTPFEVAGAALSRVHSAVEDYVGKSGQAFVALGISKELLDAAPNVFPKNVQDGVDVKTAQALIVGVAAAGALATLGAIGYTLFHRDSSELPKGRQPVSKTPSRPAHVPESAEGSDFVDRLLTRRKNEAEGNTRFVSGKAYTPEDK